MCERTMAEGARGRPVPMAGGAACGGEVVTPTSKPPQTHHGGRLNEKTRFSLEGRKLSEETSTRTPCKSEAMAGLRRRSWSRRGMASRESQCRTAEGGEPRTERDRRADAPMRPCELQGGTEPEDTGRVWRVRGVVHGTQATKQENARPRANAKLPMNCCDRRSTGPPKKTAPAMEREVELKALTMQEPTGVPTLLPPLQRTVCSLVTSSSHSLRFAALTSSRESGRFDAPFSHDEFVAALSRCHESSPGTGGLPYSTFKVSFPGGVSSFGRPTSQA